MEFFGQKSMEFVNGDCYIDGVLQSADQCAAISGAGLLLILGLMLPLILLGIALFVWWIISLVHVLSNADVENRVLWIVLILLFGTIMAPIYYFAAQRPYNKSKKLAVEPEKEEKPQAS